MSRSDVRLVVLSVIATAASGFAYFAHAGRVLPFVLSAGAIAVLAAMVGRAVDRLGERLGSGATGVVQSALGNLPELLIGIFALRAGLIDVLQAALIGSILANLLFVLGAAFVVGGIRHGTQRFSRGAPRLILLLLVVSVAIVMVPTLSAHLGVSAAHHERVLSNVAAAALLAIFVLSIPASLKNAVVEARIEKGPLWPVWLVVLALTTASVAAAFVSDWFIGSLTPALDDLHVSSMFAGFVIVAIAGNAIENFVGVKLAAQNRPDYALSLILQSPVQIAVGLIPLLVLVSNFVGPAPLTLVLPPLLFGVLALGTVVAVVIVFDGESTWLEGAALVGLYVTISTAFWWG